MALKLETQYPTRTTVDANNPNGTFKNSDPVGSLNGTPGDFAWAKDMWSFLEILMSLGSVTHNDAPDDANASQRYDALVKIARNVWPIWDLAHEYSAGVIAVGSDDNPYYSLQGANTNHDPISSPAWWRNFSFEALQTAARNVWPLWDSANTYPKGVGTVGADGNPYHSLQATNLNHNPTSSPTWWARSDLIPGATVTVRGSVFLFSRIILSNNLSDPAHDLDSSAGSFILDDGSAEYFAPAFIKLLDSNWVLGSGSGGNPGLGLSADTTYHYFALTNATGSVIDYGLDTALAATNLLAYGPVAAAGLTKTSYQGSFITDGAGNIPGFFQSDKFFQYNLRATDRTTSNVATTAVLVNLTVPSDIPLRAFLAIHWDTNALRQLLITSPFEINSVPTSALCTLQSSANVRKTIETFVKTNTSGQIRERASSSGVPTEYFIYTLGYINDLLKN